MRVFQDYNRAAAVAYAHAWAYRRNSRYYNYEELGGDCTNFASQCLYAGSGIMNFTPTWGWYYLDADRKAPAWTGVSTSWNFLTRTRQSVGRWGKPVLWKISSPAIWCSSLLTGRPLAIRPLSSRWNSPFPPQTVFRCRPYPGRDYRPLSTYVYQVCAACGLPASYGPENS